MTGQRSKNPSSRSVKRLSRALRWRCSLSPVRKALPGGRAAGTVGVSSTGSDGDGVESCSGIGYSGVKRERHDRPPNCKLKWLTGRSDRRPSCCRRWCSEAVGWSSSGRGEFEAAARGKSGPARTFRGTGQTLRSLPKPSVGRGKPAVVCRKPRKGRRRDGRPTRGSPGGARRGPPRRAAARRLPRCPARARLRPPRRPRRACCQRN